MSIHAAVPPTSASLTLQEWPEAVAIADPLGTLLVCNARFEASVVAHASVVGKGTPEVWTHMADDAFGSLRIRETFQAALTQGGDHTVRARVRNQAVLWQVSVLPSGAVFLCGRPAPVESPNEALILRAAFEHASGWQYVTDAHGIVVAASAEFARALELDLQDIIGYDAGRWLRLPSQAHAEEMGRMLVDVGEVRDVELVLLTKSGAHLTVRASANAEKNDAGEFTRAYVMLSQLSASVAATPGTLEAHSALTDAFFKAAPNAIFISDAQHRLVRANPTALALFQYDEQDLLGCHDGVLTSGKNEPRARKGTAPTTRAGSIGEFLTTFRGKNGRQFPGETTQASIRDASGATIGYIEIVRDLTPRLAALEDLRRSEALLAESQRTAKVGSWEISLGSGEVRWSQEMYRILEYADTTTQPSSEALKWRIHPEDQGRWGRLIEDVLAHGEPRSDECRLQFEDGRVRHVLADVFVSSEKQVLKRITGVMQDVSERKHIETALRTANRRLEASHSALERFTVAASQELQEPLRTILSFAKVLRREQLCTAVSAAENIIESAERMSRQIRDLIEYAQVDSAQVPTQDIELREAFDEAMNTLSPEIAESGATLFIDQALPRVSMSRDQLVQLFRHVVRNAMQHRALERAPVIEVAAMQDGSSVTVEISDNGPGIPKEYQSRVFEVFQRLSTSGVAGHEGTGMGLAIAKRIVERAGGSIWLHSKPDHGIRLCFSLPGPRRATFSWLTST